MACAHGVRNPRSRNALRDARIHFRHPSPLLADLRAAVDGYFERTGRSPHGGIRIWAKTLFFVLFTAGVWTLFLLGSGAWWQAVLAGLGSGLGIAGIGFCVQHDASHGAYSSSRRVNAWMARMLDVIGGSSHVWRTKHNIIHHTYPNLAGIDQDLEAGIFARFAPGFPRYFFHRFQHIYIWLLYGLLTVKWMWVDDFVNIGLGIIGSHKLRRPKGKEWVVFFVGKLIAIGWTFVIPVLVHGFWIGLLFHLVGHVVAGITLSLVFQLAHCVDRAEFPAVPTPKGQEMEWAAHQLATSVDFARGNRFLTWYLGGLNYQAIHHLFPHVSHVHYPALSPIVAEVTARHGVEYRTIPTMTQAIGSHYRWLRHLGAAA